MGKNKLIYGLIVILILVGAAVWIYSGKQSRIQDGLVSPIKPPAPITGKCGIQSCHGLDITCGPDVPENCDEIYMAGDNCRQFVSCQSVGGQCQLQKSARFESCKACVEKCELENKNNPVGSLDCESQCTLGQAS